MRISSMASWLLAGVCFNASAMPSIDSLPADAVPLRISAAQLSQPQTALRIDLPGRSLTFATTTSSPQAGMSAVRGRSGADNRLQVFLWNGRILSADVYSDDGRYELVNDLGGLYWVREADIPRAPSTVDETLDAVAPQATMTVAQNPPPKAAPDANGNYRIDLLVLYTATYQQRTNATPAAIQAEVQRLIFLANTYFVNSGIPVYYRLVGLQAYAGATELADCGAYVSAIAADATVRTLRDNTGADIVVLLRTSSGNVGGVGTAFNAFQQSDPPANVDPDRDGFACIAAAPNASGSDARTLDVDHQFAHELGHVLGGGHQYDGVKSLPVSQHYWRPYAHAWRCGGVATQSSSAPLYGPGLYYTIMATNNGYSGGDSCVIGDICIPVFGPFDGSPRGDFFSDPAQVHGGIGCGLMVVQPPLGEALQADNRRSIIEAAPYVAAYRPTKLP